MNSEFSRRQSPVTVGRNETASIRIKNPALSRIQCKLEHTNGKWLICDGDGSKLSTNGTWLFAESPTKIYDGIIFKAGQLLFKAKLVNNK